MALPTIQDLENLFPQLANQARGISNKSQKGKKFTERELADAISSLLTKTKSVNASQVRQTAVAAGDNDLLAQTDALESLVQGGVLQKMEEFLKGDLKAGETDDLIDQFNALNDVITSVTEQSPIAISRMIRAQVATLRSGKTSATRKATAVQNFQKVSGQTLSEESIEELIKSIEDGTQNVEELAMRMESVADDNDRMVQADEMLSQSLTDLINGVESGLIETDALTAAVADIMPILEDSSLASHAIAEQLQEDPSLEVLKDLLNAVEGQDIGNIDKEKRKELNLGEDNGFRDKVANLTPDIVKTSAETGKGFIFDLLKGGLILALLGSTGVLTTIGKILVRVGQIALNYIKETLAPKIASLLSDAVDGVRGKLSELGGFGDSQKEEVGNIVSFFADKMQTKLSIVAERIGLAFRRIIEKIPGFGSDLPIRSAKLDAIDEAVAQERYVVFRDENGRDHLVDFEGTIKLRDIDSNKALDLIRNTGAIDRRIPAEVGNFGGTFLKEVDERKRNNAAVFFRDQVNGTLVEDGAGVIEITITGDATAEAERNSAGVTINRRGRRGATGRETAPSTPPRATGPGVGRRRGRNDAARISPSVSPLGQDTQTLNVNPGAQ